MKFTDSTVAVGSVLVRALAPLLLALALGGCSNQATPHADSVEAGASREPAAVSEADPGAETTGQPPAGDPAPGGTILDADSAAATPAGEGAGKAPAGEANAGAPAAVPTSTSAGGGSTRKPEVVVPRGAEEAVKVFPMVKGEWRMWGGNPGRNMANPFEKRLP
ncbi:MAG: hypothetical protein O7J95_11265, partial [Planctomycetota bacterium]|nr:hypothetical protein [Planctomycetota bacterium]